MLRYGLRSKIALAIHYFGYCVDHNAHSNSFLLKPLQMMSVLGRYLSVVFCKISIDENATLGKKIWLSFTADSDGNILSGDSWEKVIGYFGDKVDIIGVNCSSLEGSDKAITRLIELGVDRWSVYPNFGTIDEEVGWSSEISENYINYLGKWIEMRPAMIGTCCGATPVESKILKEMISGIE